ncbi:MAG: hypothetical protein HUU01_04630 [Saprospiraceae bacterium]|nr:hypothetical protein [Saprospiraceae bacterium]
MDYKKLIEKYFAGETTLEEEKLLKAYFREEDSVEDGLKAYAPMFRFFEAEQARVLPSDFENRMPTQLTPPARRFRLVSIRMAAAAAIFLLVLLAGALVYREIGTVQESAAPVATIDWSKYEPKTPEEAIKITRAALLKVSNGMNRGATMAAETVDSEIRRLRKREE